MLVFSFDLFLSERFQGSTSNCGTELTDYNTLTYMIHVIYVYCLKVEFTQPLREKICIIVFGIYLIKRPTVLKCTFCQQAYSSWTTNETIGHEMIRNLGVATVCVIVVNALMLADFKLCFMGRIR